MYTAEHLLANAAGQALAKRSADEMPQAWDALNRYISEVFGKKQTLNVSNFCRIGWKVEDGLHQVQMRPHFNISEAFARSCRADSRSQLHAPPSLTFVEEFNFSKCALRFSEGLSKDRLFMCLRAIIQQLTEAIASGREVSIEMEVGTLRSSHRVVTFNFLAEFFAQVGLQVPPEAASKQDYQPSNTFAPPSKDALSLTVGAGQFLGTVKATDLGGFRDTSVGAPVSSLGTSGISKEELAQREARDRHLAGISEEAEQVFQQKELWEHHMRRCIEEEKKDIDWRHSMEKDHKQMLKGQIIEAREQRATSKRLHVEQASTHDFPDFTKPTDISVQDYVVERKMHLKDDLDQQVNLKRRQKEQRKALENWTASTIWHATGTWPSKSFESATKAARPCRSACSPGKIPSAFGKRRRPSMSSRRDPARPGPAWWTC